MADDLKKTKKDLLKFVLAHPINSTKILIAIRKANSLELVALWYYTRKELQRRGIK